MVPIENTAGGTAAVFKNQPKRTPYKHTDQIAHVESNRDKQQYIFVDDIEEISRFLLSWLLSFRLPMKYSLISVC